MDLALNNLQRLICHKTQQTKPNLVYETFPNSSYSPNHSATDNHFFKHLLAYFTPKTFRSKGEVETAFKDFLASRPLEFYRKGINNPVNR